MRFLFYGNHDPGYRTFGWPFAPREGWEQWTRELRKLGIADQGLWMCIGAPHDFFGLLEADSVREIVALQAWYRELEGTGTIVFQPCHTRDEVLKIVRGPGAVDQFKSYEEYPVRKLPYRFLFCGAFDAQYKDYDWGFHVLEANKRCEAKSIELGVALEGIWLCTGGVYNYFGVLHAPSVESILHWEQWYERAPGSTDIIFQIAFAREEVGKIIGAPRS
jgi:hypothetical protein